MNYCNYLYAPGRIKIPDSVFFTASGIFHKLYLYSAARHPAYGRVSKYSFSLSPLMYQPPLSP